MFVLLHACECCNQLLFVEVVRLLQDDSGLQSCIRCYAFVLKRLWNLGCELLEAGWTPPLHYLGRTKVSPGLGATTPYVLDLECVISTFQGHFGCVTAMPSRRITETSERGACCATLDLLEPPEVTLQNWSSHAFYLEGQEPSLDDPQVHKKSP